MLARHLAPAAVLAAVLLQSGCAAPHASPEAIQRLDPAALAGIESARQPALPLSLDEVVARSRAGQPSAALIDEIRRTGTRHPISPSEAVRLKAQGVAPEVLDALDEAHQRWARDEAAAARARRDAEQAAALKRAQADAERYRRSVPYADPFWPYRSYPFGYPYPHPRFAPYGGFGWGIQIRP
ncbi:hypothetical protein [Zoogloea sp.]|uniref:hypothetical protein n=1 Tax=Zoogloea sp. TaxID=49181 RepID=UPI0035ADC6D3